MAIVECADGPYAGLIVFVPYDRTCLDVHEIGSTAPPEPYVLDTRGDSGERVLRWEPRVELDVNVSARRTTPLTNAPLRSDWSPQAFS